MRLCNIYYLLPLYLVLQWKENYGHALEYFNLQSVTSRSKVCTLVYHIASSAWCPKIIYAVSLSYTTLHPLRVSSDSSGIYSF